MVDEGILKRIHALMSKTTEAGCSEAEALAASAKVQELLHKYQLSMSDIRIKEEKCTQEQYDTGIKSESAVNYCVRAIAEFTDTRVWSSWNTEYGRRTWVFNFFGLEHDVMIARYICKVCDWAIVYGAETFKDDPIYQLASKSQRPKLKQEFQLGMANRLAKRLREMKAAQQAETRATTGRDLVIVKNAVVTEEYAKLGIQEGKARTKTVRASDAYFAGQSAGNRVSLNPGVTASGPVGRIS